MKKVYLSPVNKVKLTNGKISHICVSNTDFFKLTGAWLPVAEFYMPIQDYNERRKELEHKTVEELATQYGNPLKIARIKAGLTVKELADYFQLSVNAIHRTERVDCYNVSEATINSTLNGIKELQALKSHE